MNLSEALAIGGETAVIGMGIVFGVLIILLIVLQLFKVIFYKDPAKANKAQTAVPGPHERRSVWSTSLFQGGPE